MTQHVARRLTSLALALSVAGLTTLSLTSAHAAPKAASGATTTDTRPTQDTGSALVQLTGDPLSTSAKTKPPKGKKIDFDSTTVKSVRAQLSACAMTTRRGCARTCRAPR
jgi:hypothetical protein